MTPDTYSVSTDDTRELLALIVNDTRSQMRRWEAISTLLDGSSILSPESRHALTTISGKTVQTLRGMLICAKEASRAFHKHRYGRCMDALDQFEHQRKALDVISDLSERAILLSLLDWCRRESPAPRPQ